MTVCASGASLLAVIALGFRVSSSVSFIEPLQLVTSGWEQQPLMGIWHWVNDRPVFNDFFLSPFYSANYNWFFYDLYGSLVSFVLPVTDAPMDWLPTISRLITLAIVPCLFVLTYHSYRRFCLVSGPLDRTTSILCLVFALHVSTGPLVGFWAITARPDLLSFAFEVVALVVFWNSGRRSLVTVVVAALLAYVAWALKHNAVIAPVTIVLFAVSARRFFDAIVFSCLLIGGYALTFLLAPDSYLPSLFQAKLPFLIETGVRNFINFCQKSAPQVFGIGAVMILSIVDRAFLSSILKSSNTRFVVILTTVSFCVALPGASKEGAAENYYFMASHALAALSVLVLHHVGANGFNFSSRIPVLFSTAGWALHGIAVIGLLSGVFGALSVPSPHNSYSDAQRCMRTLPQPIYASEMYLQLPWMNPSELIAFPTYNYPIHQRAEVSPFEHGGIGGMIDAGLFASLYLGAAVETLDGGSLAGYRQDDKPCGGRIVYRRIIG